MDLQKINELIKNMNVHLCEKDKEALIKYASQVEDGGLIVDIGTAAGGSAFVMALASKPDIQVITIDPVVNRDFIGNRQSLGLEKKVFFMNETSKSVFKNWSGRMIDMIFVDGVHSYEGVKSDLKISFPYLKKDCVIAIHDIFLYDDTIGKLVDQLVNVHDIKPLETIDDIFKDERRIGMFIGTKYA
jgi:predicted O-methyltransferase YrrM